MAIYSKSFSSLGLFKSTLLSAGILACSVVQAAKLEETDVNSSTLKLPQITIDGVNYKRISFQYALSGSTKIKSKSVLKETLQCHGKSVKNDYLKITYQGPKVIFRIEDHWRDRDLYVDTISTKGVTYFGQNDCDDKNKVKKTFKKQLAEWKADLEKQVTRDAISEMQNFVANNVAPTWHDHRLKVFRVTDGGEEFNIYEKAYQNAIEGFNLNAKKKLTHKANQHFSNATKMWEEELTRLKKQPGKNKELIRATHENLAKTYFFLTSYDSAKAHNDKALKLGMPKNRSLSKLIDEYNSNKKLSPQMASKFSEHMKIWRNGDIATKKAKLREVEYSTLKRSLAKAN